MRKSNDKAPLMAVYIDNIHKSKLSELILQREWNGFVCISDPVDEGGEIDMTLREQGYVGIFRLVNDNWEPMLLKAKQKKQLSARTSEARSVPEPGMPV